jgi:hypothetical protein
MSKSKLIEINGTLYKKSLSSFRGGDRCVGIAYHDGTVSVVNTKAKGPIIEFSLEEWEAFIDGVKNGEFDPYQLKRL